MTSCKQWKIITPHPLLPPVIHLHQVQGIALQRHCQFPLDLPFSKVWLLVSYHLYQQTIRGHGVTIQPVATHFITVLLVMVEQVKVIMTLLSPNSFDCLVGVGPQPHPRSLPDSPYTPRKPRDSNKPIYRHQCLCYDCVHGRGCAW